MPVQIYSLPAFSGLFELLFFVLITCVSQNQSLSLPQIITLLIRMKAETTRWALHTQRASHSSTAWHPLSVAAPVTDLIFKQNNIKKMNTMNLTNQQKVDVMCHIGPAL